MITTLSGKQDVLQYAQNGKFVIHGAGQVGITLLRYLAARDLIDSVLNFAVSDVANEPKEIMGVPVRGASELLPDSRVLIAVHPQLHNEITNTLIKYGITNITGVDWDCYLQIRRTIYDFSTEQMLGQKHLIQITYGIFEEIARQPEIIAANTAAFAEYENAFEGRDAVLLGSGPSLNKYKPIDGAIHIGVNKVYQFEKVKLDFLFAYDFHPTGALLQMDGETGYQDYIDGLKKIDCKKFIGNYLHETVMQLPERYFKEINATKYFGRGGLTYRIYRDIKYHPLHTFASIIFNAMHFALFCHPRRIFIVGCDGLKPNSIEHFYQHKGKYTGSELPPGYTANDMISDTFRINRAGWERFKQFAEIHYPDVEIISINPGYLKGLFKDMEM